MKIKKILMGVFALTLSVVGLVAGTNTVNAESTTLKMPTIINSRHFLLSLAKKQLKLS
jgi:hypothetical protein